MFPIILISLLAITASGNQTHGVADDFRLSVPVRLEANGIPIDVTVGHAAPYIIDFDGDGLDDLLVGEFGDVDFPIERLPKRLQENAKPSSYSQGKLRIYRNHGSNQQPLYKDFVYLRSGREDASIPTT